MVAMIGMTLVLGQPGGSQAGEIVSPLVGTVPPAITGTAQEGQTLSASAGTWTGSPSDFAWQWLRGGLAIAGASAASYVVAAGDVGSTLAVRVTASKAGTADVTATSAATGIVAAIPLVNTLPPVITGTAQGGQTLSASAGTWTGSPTGLAWQWRRAGVNIAGATASTYVPVAGDVGSTLTVRVTASKAGTADGTATSAATAVVTAAGGTSPVTAVAADGWRATHPAPPTFDPVGAPVTLAVTRQGFNATGGAVAVADTVTLMKRVRQPFPNQATPTADQVALSEFVYAADSLPAGVTNASALAYPLPIACWLTPDLERIRSGQNIVARLAVAHAYARNGRPVAAVKFIATDGTNTVEQTVSALSFRQWRSGLWSDYFECSISPASLNANAICTLDVIIYPWVGVPFQASVHGSPYPSPSFTVLRFLNDRLGTYGECFAYVNATTGNDGTGVVSATAATAEAAPFRTLNAARTAVQAFNNANYSRNTPGGGTIRLMPGTHVHGAFTAPTVPFGDAVLLVEGTGAAPGDTIYQDPGVTPANNNRAPHKMEFRNLTIRKVGDNITLLDNNANLANYDRILILRAVEMDLNGTTARAAYINKTGRFFAVDSALMSQSGASQANAAKALNAVGCTGAGGTSNYNAIACTGSVGPNIRPAAGDQPAAAGQLVQHCFFSQSSEASNAMAVNGAPVGAPGFAIIGTVLEHFGGNTSPALTFAADTQTHAIENALMIGTTVVGSRTNWLYQDVGTATVAKRGFMRNSVSQLYNCKTDVFGANANLTGNWPAAFHVGNRANAALRGASDGTVTPGTGAWIGELLAPNSVNGSGAAPVDPAWVNDQSFGAGGGGNGNYTPGAGTALPFVPAGSAPYSIDQRGRAVPNNGTARAGALQPV